MTCGRQYQAGHKYIRAGYHHGRKRGSTVDKSPPCDNSSMSPTSVHVSVLSSLPTTLLQPSISLCNDSSNSLHCFYVVFLFFFLTSATLYLSPYYLSLADSPLSTTALERRHYESEMGQLMRVEEWEQNVLYPLSYVQLKEMLPHSGKYCTLTGFLAGSWMRFRWWQHSIYYSADLALPT